MKPAYDKDWLAHTLPPAMHGDQAAGEARAGATAVPIAANVPAVRASQYRITPDPNDCVVTPFWSVRSRDVCEFCGQAPLPNEPCCRPGSYRVSWDDGDDA